MYRKTNKSALLDTIGMVKRLDENIISM